MASQQAQRAPDAAAAYQAQQSQLSARAALIAAALWSQVDGKNLDASFARLLPRLLAVVSAAQAKAAAAAPAYVGRAVSAAPARLAPGAFAGLTGDGRPMASLLYAPVALSKQRIGQGQTIADVITQERLHMAVLVRTQVADTGRMAQQAAIVATPRARGYIRVVHLPACPRCIILSGRFYRYSDGFLRHPNCDCTMDPVAVGSDFVTGQDPAELIAQMRTSHPEHLRKSMTEADLAALEHGADLNQVVNAHRGMTTAAGPGRQIHVTTEGTTKRGFAGQRLAAEGFAKSSRRYQRARTPRLTPAQVFEEASLNGWDRTEIVRQLTRFGYIT